MEIGKAGRKASVVCLIAVRRMAFKEIGMRKVLVSARENVAGTRDWVVVDKGEAAFHCFSTDHEEFEGGPGLYPVAVVEFPDGRVDVVRAERIRFLV